VINVVFEMSSLGPTSPGVFERIFCFSPDLPPVSWNEVKEAVGIAHSIAPTRLSWGILGSIPDGSLTGGLRPIQCWFPSQEELVYFVAFCNRTPEIYGRSEHVAPKRLHQENIERGQVDIHEVLSVVASPSSSYIERIKEINRLHVIAAEWCGGFEELCYGHSQYSLFLRQYARREWGKYSIKEPPRRSGPIAPNELVQFADICKNWCGLINSLWGLPEDMREQCDKLIQASLKELT